ncbi:hypothetical protein PFISCL1PPCAC_5090, partial [Pristionchus fissidentatus]
EAEGFGNISHGQISCRTNWIRIVIIIVVVLLLTFDRRSRYFLRRTASTTNFLSIAVTSTNLFMPPGNKSISVCSAHTLSIKNNMYHHQFSS